MPIQDEKRFYKNVQLITTNLEGVINHSDANLFPSWKEKTSIYDAHPFFEIIKTLIETKEEDTNPSIFACVHLKSHDMPNRICDITITFELTEVNITIFDYTRAYNDLNKVSQERNESVIRSQELAFTNKILLEKEAFKNEFIANINHEITTPITSIKGFLELLKKTELDYEQEELIKIIVKESEYLKRIFNDMLDLSKIELGAFKLLEENFDLNDLLNSIANSYKHITAENALDFIVDIDPKINKDAYGDKTRIYQIINNLLNNAIKYTDSGSIKFSAIKTGGKSRKQIIQICIEDTGVGIAKENQDSIFDAFTQYNIPEEGSGLGLHVVNKLVSLMGGNITLDSEEGKGTKFTLEFKIKHAQEKIEKKEKKYKIVLKNDKKYRALVVENRLSTQYLIMKFLLGEGAFFVDVVASAEEAIKAIENRKYDIMISDIKLPKMTGLDLSKTIRENYSDDFIKNIPILAVSALNTPNIKNICAANGVDSFLAKPFSQEAFIQKIAKLLSKHAK